jgi:Glu-tRNA(Gln) amidotransferase subunit E-like FAD-binding protein
MLKKTFKILQNQYKDVKGIRKTKVNELLNLYEDGHIFNKIAVQKAINEYLNHASSPVEQNYIFITR